MIFGRPDETQHGELFSHRRTFFVWQGKQSEFTTEISFCSNRIGSEKKLGLYLFVSACSSMFHKSKTAEIIISSKLPVLLGLNGVAARGLDRLALSLAPTPLRARASAGPRGELRACGARDSRRRSHLTSTPHRTCPHWTLEKI